MKKTTELMFILDRSGSMSGLESDVIGSFNSTVETQRCGEGRAFVSTVLFNSKSDVVHDRVDIEKISPMTREDYIVGGCTALYDAVGDAIMHIKNIHKYARQEDVPENTLFVIITDGMENASRTYHDKEIRRLIEKQKSCGWDFLFLGANINAAEAARNIGICEDKAADFKCDGIGIKNCMESVNQAIHSVRSKGRVDACWSNAVREDYQKRGERKA